VLRRDQAGAESVRLTTIRKILWAVAGFAAAAMVVAVLWLDYGADSARQGTAPAFRADFELTDHQGMVRRDEDFAGRWLLVFFGFANCPDVCPTTLAEVAAVMEDLGEDASRVQPLFITIDPERDTPTALASFVPRFDAGIVGLTGTQEQIERTAESFYIYYEKIEEASAPGGYAMAHSSQLFLFDPEAGFVKSFNYGTPAEEVVADLRERLQG